MKSTKIVENPMPMCNIVEWKAGANKNSSCFKFLLKKTFCDCTLKTDDGKEIFAHRIILASSSLFFQKKLLMETASNVIRVQNISYLNLCLIVKFIYAGEVAMAENRLDGFLRDAHALKIFKVQEELKVTLKPRSEIEQKNKCAQSNVNIAQRTAYKRAAEDELQGNESKKRKREASVVVKIEINDTETSRNRKRPLTAEPTRTDWDPQPPKRPRVPMIACRVCFQGFSNMTSLEHHETLSDCLPADEDEALDSESSYDEDFL